MDKIRNITQIMEVVRNQMSNKSSSARRKTQDSTKGAEGPKKPKKISQDELKVKIAQKLKSLSTDGHSPPVAAKEILLEAIILWEFGEQISNDPFFSELKSKITSAIDDNPEASDKLNRLVEQLMDSSS